MNILTPLKAKYNVYQNFELNLTIKNVKVTDIHFECIPLYIISAFTG